MIRVITFPNDTLNFPKGTRWSFGNSSLGLPHLFIYDVKEEELGEFPVDRVVGVYKDA